MVDVRVGDIVQLRKSHPCGADEWRVVRVGADIGLRCTGCDRRVMLPRHRFERRVKSIRPRPADTGGNSSPADTGAIPRPADGEAS